MKMSQHVYHDGLPYVTDRKLDHEKKTVKITYSNGYVLLLTPPEGRIEKFEEFVLTDGKTTLAHYAHGEISESELKLPKRWLAELLILAYCG